MAMPYPRPPGPRYGAVPGGLPQHRPPWPGGPRRAGFGRRLGARCIDYVLALVTAVALFILMALLVVLLTGSDETSDAQGEVWAFLFFFGWGALLFFYDWLFLAAWGATVGKMIVGVRVVRTDGGPLTQGQSVGRSAFFGLPQTLPVLGNLAALGESMAALSEDRLALHDRVCGTVVVRTRH
ncbi:RDD family protein [Nocardiopsis sp. LOL_012]|uniref:RDD family protein n=1 Tax=Nocardiopsis sp. LOL_012 TaxID=3345409 RepID=UPI003A858A84